jgi:hypothetical protein
MFQYSALIQRDVYNRETEVRRWLVSLRNADFESYFMFIELFLKSMKRDFLVAPQ